MRNSLLVKTFMIAAAMVAALPAFAVSTDYYTSSSAMSAGKWVKIKVDKSGMQQITPQQLSKWGFNDPSAVSVCGYGGVTGFNDILSEMMPDDVMAQPVVHTADGRILFYGETSHRGTLVAASGNSTPLPGIERNNAASAGYYFVTDAPVAQPQTVIPYSKTGATETYHISLDYYEDEAETPFNCGANFFGPNLVSLNKTLMVDFTMPDRDVTVPGRYNNVYLRFLTIGNGDSPRFKIGITSGETIKESTLSQSKPGSGYSYSYLTTASSPSVSTDITNFTFKIAATPAATGKAMTVGSLDWVALAYPRRNRLGDNAELLMLQNSLGRGVEKQMIDADENMLVWNVENPYNVLPYETVYDAASRTMGFTTDRSYDLSRVGNTSFRAIAFNPDATHNSVEYAGTVANQNLHALPTPDLLIVASDECYAQAERLAALHRMHLGQDVVVLRQEQIFNEFSSGTPTPWAIRRIAKMFYDRDPQKFRSLLLFGAGSFDNRGITASAANNKARGALLMTYPSPDYRIASSEVVSFTTDSYFGYLDDITAQSQMFTKPMRVNVGRIPALDIFKATQVVNKIEKYLTDVPIVDAVHRILLMADSTDTDQYLRDSESLANMLETNMPGGTYVKAYNEIYKWSGKDAAYLCDAASRALKQGVGFFSYAGHGNSSFFGKESRMWSTTRVNETDYTYFPYAVLATCHSYEYDRLLPSIAEDMLYKENGGMIGIIGSCREVYATRNKVLADYVAEFYSKADENTLTGDVFRLAVNKTYTQYGMDYLDNSHCYNYCGDPALPLYKASPRVVIEKINNAGYSADGSLYRLAPMTSNTISGYIAVDAGSAAVDESFNGTAMISLFESPTTRTSLCQSSGDQPRQVVMDEDVLVEVLVPVKDGRFSVTFTPPMPSRKPEAEKEYNRFTVLAATPDFKTLATTASFNTIVDESLAPENIDDTEAPVISQLYIDRPGFRSGDTTEGEFTLYAVIEKDESGLSMATASIGASTRITIDGSRLLPVVGTAMTTDDEGRIHISCPVSSINDGRHTLTLFTTDNVGNSTSRSIEFVVVNKPVNANLSVLEHPARVHATFVLNSDFAGTPCGRLIIEDMAGNTVHTAIIEQLPNPGELADRSLPVGRFPYEWDLFGLDGNPVADGRYRAYAILNSELQYATTPIVEFVVVQAKYSE